MTASTEPCIEFLCAPEDLGVIAAPVPAREALPDWFRRLAPVDKHHLSTTDNALTVKRCMPFLDALMAGWMLPLAATVRIEIADNGQTVNTGWDFDKTMVSNHHPYQVSGHPDAAAPAVQDPQPLDHPHAAGLELPLHSADEPAQRGARGGLGHRRHRRVPLADQLSLFRHAPDGFYTLEKGTPLVQVIPFRRDDLLRPGVVRAETEAEAAERQRILRATGAGDGWYRKEARDRRS
jgi:hypothetical protein